MIPIFDLKRQYGEIKEEIQVNATYPVVKWKMNQMKSKDIVMDC